MIEQHGKVISVEPGRAWVETVRSAACDSCAMKAGCGQGTMMKLGLGQRKSQLQVKTDFTVKPGDTVVFAVDENLLLKSALWFYLFPLLGLFIAAIVTTQIGLSEPFVVFAGLIGFWIAWSWMRSRHYKHDDPSSYPVVIRVSGPPDIP